MCLQQEKTNVQLRASMWLTTFKTVLVNNAKYDQKITEKTQTEGGIRKKMA